MEYPVNFDNKSYDISKLTQLETHQAYHQANFTKYSILEYFVRFTCTNVCCGVLLVLEGNAMFMKREFLFNFLLLFDIGKF